MRNEHPLYRVVAGAFLVLVAFIAACFTIVTDESLIQGGNGNVALSYEVFQQPWYLLNGQYSGIMAWSVIGAWMVFCVYVIFSVLEHFKDDKVMKTVVWILITIDGIGNYLYFKGVPTIYQMLLTGLIFFCLSYGGKKGVGLFFSGLSEMSATRRSRYAEEE
jgi:hypothetical protein